MKISYFISKLLIYLKRRNDSFVLYQMRKCNCPVVFYFLILEKREREKGKKNIYDLVYNEKKELLSEIFENTYASSDGCMTDFHLSEKEIVWNANGQVYMRYICIDIEIDIDEFVHWFLLWCNGEWNNRSSEFMKPDTQFNFLITS